jgi:hypothetical protein
MQTSFQEFLRQKVEGSDWRDRKRLRDEWLGALNRLLDQIRDWLRESDPKGVLELITYEVERVEGRLGVYDAPALKIRLNTDAAEVLPMGRFAIKVASGAYGATPVRPRTATQARRELCNDRLHAYGRAKTSAGRSDIPSLAFHAAA